MLPYVRRRKGNQMSAPYYMRRVVSWVCYHLKRGGTLTDILAANAKRKPPFTEQQIREAFPLAQDACRNATLLSECGPDTRLCDMPGFTLPE